MAALPTEVFLHIGTYLAPLDQETLIRTFSHLAPLFTWRQFESTDGNGDTILHLQARTRRRGPKIGPDYRKGPSFLSLLTSNPGSYLHPQNHAGATPLMAATRAHNLPFMRLLLERDPGGVNITDKEGATALWHAIFTLNSEGIALLLQQPLINANHRMGVVDLTWEDKEIEVTPLIWALSGGLGAYKVVAPFLAHSAIDLTCVDGNGRNPLMLAVMSGDKDDRVGRILERRRLALTTFPPGSRDDPAPQPVPGNFDINAIDRGGETALQIAAWEGAAESIKLILSQEGVEADMANLLHRAIYHHAIEAILAHGGVDVDHLDQGGRSALSNAVTRDDCESARVLLRYGARPDLQHSDGYTPISRAAMAMQADMVELLERAIGII
ncbi:ankyrin repeat-containing domain protein [Aspergillus pseudoustus]|uniref:Ankyrin repeat-containing domain protein n=1 Tax=Aspergillus pseudoustus TaxID=1810923 RepID=A0ABR4KG56_9EURO